MRRPFVRPPTRVARLVLAPLVALLASLGTACIFEVSPGDEAPGSSSGADTGDAGTMGGDGGSGRCAITPVGPKSGRSTSGGLRSIPHVSVSCA